MAFETSQLVDGVALAASDLSAKQFYAVKFTSTANNVDLASTGGEAIFGIVQNKPKAGQPAAVCFAGASKAAAGAAFSAGDYLMTDTTGRLITATSTNHRVAIAREAAGAAAAIVTVQVLGQGSTVA